MSSSTQADQMLVTMTRADLEEIVEKAVAAGKAAPPEREPWVDVPTAAKHAGVVPMTIRNWIEKGMPASHLGREYRVRLSELDAWLVEHRANQKLALVK
jgi:excisionase family DNA binding protein